MVIKVFQRESTSTVVARARLGSCLAVLAERSNIVYIYMGDFTRLPFSKPQIVEMLLEHSTPTPAHGRGALRGVDAMWPQA